MSIDESVLPLLHRFGSLSDTEKVALFPQLCALVSTNTNPRIRPLAARALRGVPGFASTIPNVEAAIRRLETDLQESPSAILRSTSLEALVALGVPIACGQVECLLKDISPRVRRTAVRLCCHKEGANFEKLCEMLLSDTDSAVRSALVDAIFDVSQLEPGTKKEGGGASRKSAAFTYLSTAVVLDTSTEVRSKACRQMGLLQDVPEELLVGSLSKWPPGAAKDLDVHDVAPSKTINLTKIKNPNIRITSLQTMAAGAFAHAAEDEFFTVREAAIESLQRLGAGSRVFSDASLELLTDMLNDPIDQVRIRAIEALGSVSARSALMDEQLRTVLSVLDEASTQVRLAVHGLLASARVTQPSSVVIAVGSLMQSIRNFEENESAFATLRAFGWNNAELFGDAIGDLLGLDPRFAPVERLITDIDYMGRAIAILNAAYRNPKKIVPKLPEFVVVHSVSFHEKYPNFFPGTLPAPGSLGEIDGESVGAKEAGGSEDGYDLGEFMRKALKVAYAEVPQLYSAGRVGECETLLNECSRDVRRVATLTQSAEAKFHYSYLARMHSFVEMDRGSGSSELVTRKAQSIIEQAYSMEYVRFTELPPQARFQLRLMRCAAHLALTLNSEDKDSAFVERVRELERSCDSENQKERTATMLLGEIAQLEEGKGSRETESKFIEKVKHFQREYLPEDPSVTGGIKRVHARIIYPEEQNIKAPAEYQSDLPLLMHVKFRISKSAERVLGTVSLAVKVGERTDLWPIKSQHVVGAGSEYDDNCMLVDVPIRIVHTQVGPEPLAVGITVVRTFAPDIKCDVDTLPLSKTLFYYIKPKKMSIFNN